MIGRVRRHAGAVRSPLSRSPLPASTRASVRRTSPPSSDSSWSRRDRYPEATGELSNLLYDIALAAKIIAAAIRRAGLVNILGRGTGTNVQGEVQQKLDVFANDTIKNGLMHTGRVCVMGSEEDDDVIPVPPQFPVGKYAVLFDPLDGSSNIDVNSAVGTIFSIYRRVSMEGRGTVADVLQPGAARSRPATSCTAPAR